MAIKKKTVLLINPGHEGKFVSQHIVPHRIHRDIPPVSILSLASYLQKKGENIAVLDSHIEANYLQKISEIIRDENIGLVGITTFAGRFIGNAQEITDYIKSNYPRMPVVWGGPLTSTLPEACLREGRPDYIVFFSGEEPLRLLLESIRNNTAKDIIPNIGFLKDGVPFYTKKDYNPLIYSDPLDWGLLGENINIRQVPYLAYLFTSRGCPYGCRFCYHQTSFAKNMRRCFFRSPESVLSEIRNLNEEYGINVFTFGDDNFFSNKKRALKILTSIREIGCYLEQAIGTFSDFTDEVISHLEGVCQTVICSIETASEKLLKIINKPFNLSRIPEININLSRAGINTVHNFMFGLPGETDEDRKSAVDLMVNLKNINPYVRGMAYFFTPLPGTPMLEDIEKEFSSFPKTLSFWKDCEIDGLEESYNFRPWLKKHEQMFISDLIIIFKEVFQSINEPSPKLLSARINSSSRLRYIFSSASKVNYPKDRNPKYLLDSILKDKDIIFP